MPFLLGTGVGLRPKPPYGQTMSASSSASGTLGKGLHLAIAAFTALCTATGSVRRAVAFLFSVTLTPQIGPGCQDTFSRANQSGWGTASDGNAWTQRDAGTPTLAIAASKGTYTGSTAFITYTLGPQRAAPDGEALVRFSLSGASDFFHLVLDYQDHFNFCRLYGTAGSQWYVSSSSDLDNTTSASGGTITAGQTYWARLRRAGTGTSGTLSGKVWADGTTEPAAWGTQVTDDTGIAFPQSAGYAGVGVALASGAHTLSLDSFSATPLLAVLLGRGVLHGLAATCAATITLLRAIAHTLATTCTGATTVTKAALKGLAATCTATVVRTQAIAHTLASSITGTVSVGKALFLAKTTFAASLAATVVLLRAITHTLSVTLGSTATLLHAVTHALAATCTAAPTVTKAMLRALAATCTATVTLLRAVTHTLVATLGATAALLRASTHALASTITGTVSVGKALLLALATFTASVSALTGTLTRTPAKALSSTITATVASIRAITHAAAASITPQVVYGRAVAKAVASTLTGTVARVQKVAHTLAGTWTAAGALGRTYVFARTSFTAFVRPDPYPLGTVDCADTFVRADQSGWGTASDGNTWSATGLTTALTSNEGTATGSASQFVTTLGPSSATSDQEVLVRVKASAIPVQAGPVARMTTNTTWVAASMNTGGISIIESKPGNSFNHSVGGSVSAGTYYWMRLRVVGALAWVRTWADGTVEPLAWNSSPTALQFATNVGKAGLVTWLSHAGDTLSVDTFSATPVLSTPPAWQLSKVLASTCTATVSFAKAIAGLARTIFSANLPPAPGTLLSTPSQQDTFARADQSGWGTASDGESWATPPGVATPTMAIVSNKGTVIGSTLGDVYAQALGTASYTDVEVLGRFAVCDTHPYVGFQLRSAPSANSVSVTLHYVSTVRLDLNGTGFDLGLGVNALVWLRVRVRRGTVFVRAWADGTSEPTDWTLQGSGYSVTALRRPCVYWTDADSTLATTASTVDSVTVTPFAPLSLATGKALSSLITATVTRAQQIARAIAATITPQVIYGREDTFGRADQSGWGTATDGNTWAHVLGAVVTQAISSGEGTLQSTALQINGYTLGAAMQTTDSEVLVRFKVSAFGLFTSFALYQSYGSSQYVRVSVNNNGSWSQINSDGSSFGVNGGDPGAVVAGSYSWLRLRRQSGTVNARLWADGSAEPGTWATTNTHNIPSAASTVGLSYSPHNASDTCYVDHFSARPLPGTVYGVGRAAAKAAAATLTQTTTSVRAVLKALAASTPPSALALTPAVQDTFVRPDQSGWGTASDGTPWTVFQEGGYTRAISGNTGTLTNQTNQEILTLGSAPSSPRQEALVRFKVNTFGPQTSLGLYLRYAGSASYIALNVRGSAGTWRVIGLTAGLQTSSDDAGTLSAGTLYWARVRAVDATVYGKVWADGTTEPTAWGATVTGGRVPLLAGWTALSVQLDAITDVLFVNSFSATPLQSAVLSRNPAKALASTLTQTVTRVQQIVHATVAATITQSVSFGKGVFHTITTSPALTLGRTAASATPSSTSTYSTTVLADSPRAYWILGEAAGATTVADSSGNGYTGTVTSAGVLFGQPAFPGLGTSAAYFPDDPNSLITFVPTGLPTTTAYTLEAWCQPLVAPSHSQRTMVAYGAWSGTVDQFNSLQFSDAGVAYATESVKHYWGVSAQNPLIGSAGTLEGNWHHVVATWDGTTRTVYLDGVQRAQATASGLSVDLSGGGHIGLNAGTGDQMFGWLAHVAIYNTALSSARVTDHYLAGSGTSPAKNTAVARSAFSATCRATVTYLRAIILLSWTAASVPFATALTRLRARELVALLTATGSALSGAFVITKALASRVTATVTRAQQIAHTFAATCTASAQTLRTTTYGLAHAHIETASVLARTSAHRIAALLTGQVQMARAILSNARSRITHGAHLQRGTAHSFVSSSLVGAAQLTRRTLRLLGDARIASLAVLMRGRLVVLEAALHISLHRLARASSVHLSTPLRTLALLGKQGPPVLLFAAVSTLGTLRRRTMLVAALRSAQIVGAGVRPVGTIAKALRARTPLGSTLARVIVHPLEALLSTAVLLGRGRYNALAATLYSTSALLRRTLHARQASLEILSELGRASVRQIAVHLDLEITSGLTLSRDVIYGLGAALGTLSRLSRDSASLLMAQISPSALIAGIYSAFLPLVRATLVPIVRLLTLLARVRALDLLVPARGSAFLARAPERALVPQERTQALVVVRSGGPMIAVPSRTGASAPYLSPAEEHVSFTIDVSSIVPTGLHIVHVNTLSVTTKLPGAPDSAAVLASINFLLTPLLSGTTITLVAGDGTQVLGMDTEIELQIVLSNTPATKETLYVTLPCRKG